MTILKPATWIFLLVLAFSSAGRAQSDVERTAVRQAVLDYVEGVYEVAPERIERSVHPDLMKRGFYIKKGETAYNFEPMSFAELVNLAKTYNKNGRVPKNAAKEITVYDVLDQTAIAKLVAVWGVDYFQLAKFNGKWMIVNILWQTAPRVSAPISQNNEANHREIAVTFDDLPMIRGNLPANKSADATRRMTENNRRLLAIIAADKIPAVGFVNEGRLYSRGAEDAARVETLRAWTDAGLELGNHTFSHISIDDSPLAAYQKDVIRGEKITKRLLAERGKKLRYFRHTQLRTGPTKEYKKGLADFLAARGYTVAPVTIDNNEYVFAAVYERALERGDTKTMKRVSDAYLEYMTEIFEFFEKLSVESLGYEVKQTLLLHANALNADYFDELVSMLKKRGYKFISLDDALKDKAYSLPEAQANKGLSWLHRWRLAKGLKLMEEPREPKFIAELYAAYGKLK